MRRALMVVLLVALTAVAIDVLGDRTQNRPDWTPAGSRTVVTFDVDTRRAEQPVGEAARALWQVCGLTVPNQLVALEIRAGGTGTGTLTPALGPHELERITGCLQDATIDRVWGDVLSVVDEPAA
jgi:hypothetical protein